MVSDERTKATLFLYRRPFLSPSLHKPPLPFSSHPLRDAIFSLKRFICEPRRGAALLLWILRRWSEGDEERKRDREEEEEGEGEEKKEYDEKERAKETAEEEEAGPRGRETWLR